MENQIEILNKRFYSLELKHKVCKEHIDSKIRISELTRKYKLSSHALIHHWLRQLGYIQSEKISVSNRMLINFDNDIDIQMIKKSDLTSNCSPEQIKIKQLEQDLIDAKLIAEGYKSIIDLAEKELKIPIRKKFNSK